MSTFLPIFTVTLFTSWFSLNGVTFHPYHRLMPFLITFLLLLIWKYLQTIVTLYRKPLHTLSWRPSIWKPLRLISTIPAWLRTLSPTPLNCLNNTTVSLARPLIFTPHTLATKNISPKPPNPSMTPAILASKRHRRYLERVWRGYPTALNRSRLSKQIYLCNRQMSKSTSAHYSKIIAEHSGDHRSLWQAFNKILHRCPKMYLPDHSSIAALAILSVLFS